MQWSCDAKDNSEAKVMGCVNRSNKGVEIRQGAKTNKERQWR